LTRIYLIECSIYASNSTTMQLSKNFFAGLFRFQLRVSACLFVSDRNIIPRPSGDVKPWDKFFGLSPRRHHRLLPDGPYYPCLQSRKHLLIIR
jgi:hypothetical protein